MLTAAKRWALAPCAILTRYNLDDPFLLGGLPPGEAESRESRELLAEHWNIQAAADARKSIGSLLERGQRAGYDAIRAGATGTKKQLRFIKQHGAELGERSLIAWDLGRVSFVAGKAYVAGFLEEAEAWTACMQAARVLQQQLTSWEAFGRDYLLGREWFFGETDRAMHHIYRALVLEREGAWSIAWATSLRDLMEV